MKPFSPQLAMNLNPNKLEQYAEDNEWWFEQKLDGVRISIECDNGTVIGWNRRGNQITLTPRLKETLAKLNGRFVFDGEWINETIYCFDLPLMDALGRQITLTTPYEERRKTLEALSIVLEQQTNGEFRLLPTKRTASEKHQLIATCKTNRSEGIMVKHKDAPYWCGKRSPRCLKSKFTETADVIVTEVGRQGKRSIAIAVFDDDRPLMERKLVDVGACTITDRILGEVKVGDVVEVKYLYATKEHKLYQPAFLKIRDDKVPSDCTLGQFKYVNKEVHSA